MRVGVLNCLLGVFALAAAATAVRAQQTETYSYDVHGRLTAVARTNGSSTESTTYGLDNADNRTSKAAMTPLGGAMSAEVREPQPLQANEPTDQSERPEPAMRATPLEAGGASLITTP